MQFLKHFEIWYHKEKSISMKRMILLLDNCSSHRSQHSVKFMEKSKINFMFIPTYSPQLAAVELVFNTLKKRLNSSANGSTIKLAQEEGFEKISSCIRRFRVNEIRSYFRKYLNRLSIIWICLLKMLIQANKWLIKIKINFSIQLCNIRKFEIRFTKFSQ